MHYLGIDIGGTWIKGAMGGDHFFAEEPFAGIEKLEVKRIKSPLNAEASPEDFLKALTDLAGLFGEKAANVDGIGISTAGIVDYHGEKVLKAAAHLNVLKDERWRQVLETHLHCTATIINDADAAAIGLAEAGFLKGNKTVGIMPVGTGLGLSVWRNGRRWQPGKVLPLLGSIRTPQGNFDAVASASRLAAADPDGRLENVLLGKNFVKVRQTYLKNLAEVINTAAILYNLDEVVICGGLAAAASSSDYPLEQRLNEFLKEAPPERDKPVVVMVAPKGNKWPVAGALFLARGEAVAERSRETTEYAAVKTEIPYNKDIRLEKLKTADLIHLLWNAEQEAGNQLEKSLPLIEKVVENTTERLARGGRLIYIGCGTSGRIAAMDAVEIPCTYGFPEDRILCLIPGGIADAAIEIESDFEEDASAVPEMLLINISPHDVVIGISASGTARYVQSALAFAKDKGAYTLLIKSHDHGHSPDFVHDTLYMHSGYEVVAGSTRMKAGTATKKILNFISSSVMIRLGKVAGPYMIDVACVNKKLVERATDILVRLYQMPGEEAKKRLQEANMHLRKVIESIEGEGS